MQKFLVVLEVTTLEDGMQDYAAEDLGYLVQLAIPVCEPLEAKLITCVEQK